MDHSAADYADTLRDAAQDNVEELSGLALAMLGEVARPDAVTWVECDYNALAASRIERGSKWGTPDPAPFVDGLRGYLFDDRHQNHLLITMFCQPEGSKIMDPLCAFRVNRTLQGELDYDAIKLEAVPTTIEFLARTGNPEKRIYAFHELHKLQTGYELFIPRALFAMLASPDLGGIIPHEGKVFTAKDMKTARKFGKTWVMGAQKSHLTIRIGPHAIAHMRERQARLEFERQQQKQRNGPVRHWVSEHERRNQSGKVVWINGHYRGAGNLPTRVMGPSNADSKFDLKSLEAFKGD